MVKVYRGGRRVRRRIIRRKGGKRPTLARLAKDVKKLKRVRKINTKWCQLIGTYNANCSADLMYYNLDKFSSLTPMFGMALADGDENVVCNYSDLIRMNFDLANGVLTETDKVNFHVFLVTLKDEIGSAFNSASGTITLTNSVHYYQAGTGLYVLNPKVFKVHAQKRFVLDNHGVALTTSSGQTQYGTQLGFDMYMKRNEIVRTTGADWIALPCPPDASKNAFILIFNDNSALDAQYPSLQLLHKKTVRST